ncbi:MAG: DUF983 domain-containing protein [Fluviicola sp.]|nr:DUF983 domain-containing protein [Fluviicola sp.]
MASFHSTITGKCPNCEKGDIFERNGNIFLLRVPKMHEKCTECGYRFEKEPGYFLGAMYVSYGLTILEMFVVFFATFWFVPLWLFFTLIFTTLVVFSLFNFRWARIIWINLFPY